MNKKTLRLTKNILRVGKKQHNYKRIVQYANSQDTPLDFKGQYEFPSPGMSLIPLTVWNRCGFRSTYVFRRVIKSIVIINLKVTTRTEKLSRYKDLVIEIRKMWKVKTEIVPVTNGASGTIKTGTGTFICSQITRLPQSYRRQH